MRLLILRSLFRFEFAATVVVAAAAALGPALHAGDHPGLSVTPGDHLPPITWSPAVFGTVATPASGFYALVPYERIDPVPQRPPYFGLAREDDPASPA